MSKSDPKAELTIKQKITLLLVVLAIKVVQPTEYTHELSGSLNNILELIGLKKGKYDD